MNEEQKEAVDYLAIGHGGFNSNSGRFLPLDRPLTDQKMQPSVENPPTLELKPLPSHLKYMFLGDKSSLPVIISS